MEGLESTRNARNMYVITVTLLILISCIKFAYDYKQNEENSSVKKGEIWRYAKNKTKNPFHKIEYNFYKVLNVQDGYAEYMNLPSRYVSSCSVSEFKYDCDKIK